MNLPDENTIKVPSDFILSAAEWRDYLDLVETSQSDRAYYPDVSAGLRLGICRIEEDEKENYDEAVKLYQECRKHLQQAFEHVTSGSNSRMLIRRKFNQLQDRILVLRLFQMGGAHLADRIKLTALSKAREVLRKAVNAEDNKNHKEALTFYKECEKYLLHALEHEVSKDSIKDMVHGKLTKVATKIKVVEAIVEEERISKEMSQMNCN